MALGALLWGGGIGAALAWLFDPAAGRRRRALLRDQTVHLLHESEDAVETAARDALHRARGFVAEARSLFEPDDAPDPVVRERIRAMLGLCVAHPRAIEVRVEGGQAVLEGHVLADEVDALRSRVARVRGVTAVDDRLQVHAEPGNVPQLQGGRAPRLTQRGDALAQWTPATRAMVGTVAGAALLLVPRTRRLAGRLALGTVGAGLMNRVLAGRPGACGSRGLEIEKTLEVDAPVERVFAYWQDLGNLPRVMRNVRQVAELGDGRSRWTVEGPAQQAIEWEARITRLEPNRCIAWETTDHQPVQHAGSVSFAPTEGGGTRVDVRLSYRPPGGAAGHAVARLFGADPDTEVAEDLARLKSVLESEAASGGAG